MKLYHGQYILPALAGFLVLAIVPVWRGLAARGPVFQSPPNPHGEKCIEPKAFMRAEHMRLLMRWRDEVVRENDRVYTASDGRKWEKSLRTCVNCHGHVDAQGKSTTAAASCNECHTYVNAKLDCWNCHHETATAQAPAPPAVGTLSTASLTGLGAEVIPGTLWEASLPDRESGEAR